MEVDQVAPIVSAFPEPQFRVAASLVTSAHTCHQTWEYRISIIIVVDELRAEQKSNRATDLLARYDLRALMRHRASNRQDARSYRQDLEM